MNTLLESSVNQKGWVAKLDLEFGYCNNKTILKKRKHIGPLQVQKPFYPEGDKVSHIYILHPPGGVVGGDTLSVNLKVEDDSHVLATSPAATKFYRSDGRIASQQNNLTVSDGILEWLPQETIIFDGAKLKSKIKINLLGQSKFIGWEVVCLGRPASGEKFSNGFVSQSFEIWRNKKPLWIEHNNFIGGGKQMEASWGLAGYPVTGTLVSVTRDAGLKEKILKAISCNLKNGIASITSLDDVLLCRYLGEEVEEAKEFFISVWGVIRPALIGRELCVPRIWNR